MLKTYLKLDNIAQHPHTTLSCLNRIKSKISFVTSFTIFKLPKKYYFLDVVLGCTITTDNLSRILECSHVDAAKEQCGQCVCQIVSFFQNKTKAKIIGQLPICKA